MDGDFVLDIHSHDYMKDITDTNLPPGHKSVLNSTNINKPSFVGKYQCVYFKIGGIFEIKVLDENVTYIFVKGL